MVEKKVNTTADRYQLRHAAGIDWLLNMEQEGIPYHKPIPVNETGAKIWELQSHGHSKEEIAVILAKEYEIPVEEAAADVDAFLKMLEIRQKKVEESK